MLNKHVYKVIGSRCGGLLDIAKDTINFSGLNHVVGKLKEKEGGMIQEFMDLYCWGKRV